LHVNATVSNYFVFHDCVSVWYMNLFRLFAHLENPTNFRSGEARFFEETTGAKKQILSSALISMKTRLSH
jgi:hypothetical protein